MTMDRTEAIVFMQSACGGPRMTSRYGLQHKPRVLELAAGMARRKATSKRALAKIATAQRVIARGYAAHEISNALPYLRSLDALRHGAPVPQATDD